MTIRTTHVGSLPRPKPLLDLLAARQRGDDVADDVLADATRTAVADVVAAQREHGVDVVTDGEMGKLGFFSYVTERLGGLERRPGAETVYSFAAEQEAFPDYYERYFAQAMMGGTVGTIEPVVCTGPLVYQGQAALQRDLDNLAAAVDPSEAFVPSIAPSGVGVNEYYGSEEEYYFAVADAMNVEYRAIVDAGFTLQVDDPFLTEIYSFHQYDQPTRERRGRMYVEAINHALRGIPTEKVRFHTCYSINEGPRVFDVPLADVIDLVLAVDARYYSFEAANARHEHEYHLWETVTLPDDKVLIPGVITHASNIVEHPELIAERLERFARLVGPERVMAGADCGFSSQASFVPEVDPTVMWAKFDAMAAGARLASSRLNAVR
ncbi:5-methyltetrahydropteroyltriglutamate--homocysteine methyltransferase [Actinomycetospora succinea]|uniref:5-methyltetrahydropteroyltriglutamate--homocysteine methyltransferase n=1 Tax=Actinomycetospora succinea TaxID=663603 RepID=A0A4R6VIF1_9PSEU|nr:cobalamin-independent methionine synthase II family protein [Actinomycetospora succinea]TDQ63148.1 5-methyltetrahydropteroyltriglutamate--homocysteine methyltransferase [Actinomycetospora succinea]